MDADETNPPEKIVIAVTTLLFIWTTCFAAVRCWAKTSQQLWSYFDAVFVTAFVSFPGSRIAGRILTITTGGMRCPMYDRFPGHCSVWLWSDGCRGLFV